MLEHHILDLLHDEDRLTSLGSALRDVPLVSQFSVDPLDEPDSADLKEKGSVEPHPPEQSLHLAAQIPAIQRPDHQSSHSFLEQVSLSVDKHPRRLLYGQDRRTELKLSAERVGLPG